MEYETKLSKERRAEFLCVSVDLTHWETQHMTDTQFTQRLKAEGACELLDDIQVERPTESAILLAETKQKWVAHLEEELKKERKRRGLWKWEKYTRTHQIRQHRQTMAAQHKTTLLFLSRDVTFQSNRHIYSGSLR